MAQFYVPFNDPELIDGAEYANEKNSDKRKFVYVTGSKPKVLVDMAKDDPLLILAHGRYSTADQIAGVLKDKTEVYLTAAQLVTQMVTDGLPFDVSDGRLLVCWSGYTGGAYQAKHTVKRTEGDAPYAGQLSSGLKGAGCKRVIVTGYTGEVYLPNRNKPALDPNVVVMDRSGQDGGRDYDQAVGKANQSLLDILRQIGTDEGKRAVDLRTRTVWL